MFADAIHDCNITATCKLFSVCHFLNQILNIANSCFQVSAEAFWKPHKIRKFGGVRGSALDPARGRLRRSPNHLVGWGGGVSPLERLLPAPSRVRSSIQKQKSAPLDVVKSECVLCVGA